jgi:zinc and cadmium transporter
LIGGAFFHLLPEALTIAGAHAFPTTVFGILLFFTLEKVLSWRLYHAKQGNARAFTYLNLLGDSIHNFLDGALIAGAFLVSTKLGLITTALVVFHEVPHELGDFGVLIYGGFSRLQALGYNLLSALAAVVGGISTYLFSVHVHNLQAPLLAISAGGFLYVALVDLLPELHKQRRVGESLVQFALILLGLVVVWGGELITPGE